MQVPAFLQTAKQHVPCQWTGTNMCTIQTCRGQQPEEQFAVELGDSDDLDGDGD